MMLEDIGGGKECLDATFGNHTEKSTYYFDSVQDDPAIGGVVEVSNTLFRLLKQQYSKPLVSVREANARLVGPDATMPYLHRGVAARIAARDLRLGRLGMGARTFCARRCTVIRTRASPNAHGRHTWRTISASRSSLPAPVLFAGYAFQKTNSPFQ